MTPFDNLPDDELLALCVDREARSEPYPCRVAVGSTVLNRVSWGLKHKGWGKVYGNSIHTVILAPAQYSWTNSGADHNHLGAVDIAKDFEEALKGLEPNTLWLESNLEIARGLITGTVLKNTSAMYYKEIGCSAAWAKGKTPILTLGKLEFFA